MNSVFPVILAGLLLGAGCAPSDESGERPQAVVASPTERSPALMPPPAERTLTARGVVRSISPSRSHLVVAHERIPGFMDAMTMPFSVAHPSVVEGLLPGDSITFAFTTGRDGVEVRSVERSSE